MIVKFSRLAFLVLFPAALAFAPAGAGAAQQADKKPTSPFGGFSSDSGKPVDIKSDSLEIHQNENRAIFTGNVVAVQGDSVLHTNELTVFYDNSAVNGGTDSPGSGGKNGAKAAAADAKPAPAPAGKPAANGQAGAGGQGNSIKKLIAKGNVVVTSKDQRATGEYGVMETATNLATLTGKNVVMIQGPNVLKGTKLVVNMKTGVANVQGGGGGVSGVFTQSNDKKKNSDTDSNTNSDSN